jgi:hypothetical protein
VYSVAGFQVIFCNCRGGCVWLMLRAAVLIVEAMAMGVLQTTPMPLLKLRAVKLPSWTSGAPLLTRIRPKT